MNKNLEVHRIPDTSILVDAFRKPVSEPGFEYILSHFHGDHYGRLSERWDAVVHCSPLTGRLAVAVLGLREELVCTHNLREKFDLAGACVEFLDADHCPGAVMVLATPAGSSEKHLHTGDFRASSTLIEAVQQLESPKVHTLLLDSTYALSKSSFPAQREVVERIADDLSRVGPSTLILIAAYSVGKERVILRVAEKLDCRIYAGSEKKRNIYSILDMTESERSRFTLNPSEAQIHVVHFGFCGEIWPFFQPNFTKCEEYIQGMPFDTMVGVLPTGHADASNWNRKHEVVSRGNVTLRLYAYSEHSSPEELSAFVGLVKPVRLVPTVFRDKKEAAAIVRRFQPLLDQAGAARQLFGKGNATPQQATSTIAADKCPATGSTAREEDAQAVPKPAATSPPNNPRQQLVFSGVTSTAGTVCLDISDEEGCHVQQHSPQALPNHGEEVASSHHSVLAEEHRGVEGSYPQAIDRDAAIAAVIGGLGRDAEIDEVLSLLQSNGWDVSATLAAAVGGHPADPAPPSPKQRRLESGRRQASLKSFFGGM